MKVLVCGGRTFGEARDLSGTLTEQAKTERWQLLQELDSRTPGLTHVIHGNARGADALAEWWALQNKIQPVACQANWDFHGKAAGSIRNGAMLKLLRGDEGDYVLAFPGGRGTADMIRRARGAGFPVIEVPSVVA